MISLHVSPNHEEMSQAAAERLAVELRRRPDSLLCLATGATPTRTYELLAGRRSGEPGLFALARILKLDEWGGIPPDDSASCEQYLRRSLIDVLDLHDSYVGFATDPADPAAECRRVEEWLDRNGPIDLCVLGLGVNGHLGFNEPARALIPRAHVARLSESSLGHSMLKGASRTPTYGLTLGMADLLQSRRIALLVSGAAKREPLRRVLEASICTEFPASFLQLHADVSIYCDAAAWPQ
jgi:galactosamine-6-phosphate isomerase